MTTPTTNYEVAANLAIFLQEKTGSVCGTWRGRLSAAEQRALMGRFIGKGKLTIDGAAERVSHVVGRCFGLDFETTYEASWREVLGVPSGADLRAARRG